VFGSQPVLKTSAAQSFTITATGSGAIKVAGVSVVGVDANQFAQKK
jgi:hypothetical protein